MLKKIICIILAAFVVTSPAAAQFTGFGKAILDKAKEKAEEALAEKSDGPQKKDPASSKAEDAPPASSNAVPVDPTPRCYSVSSVNAFTKDVTQFRYCNSEQSVLELSAPVMAAAPDGFQTQGPAPAGVKAEVRIPNETVPASLGYWAIDSRGGYHHTLTIGSPTDAVKVARTINAGQPFDIVLVSGAGEAFVAFSGAFEVKFPQELVGGIAPQSAVSKASPTIEAKANPKSGKVDFADPLGEACARNSMLSGLYNCGCVAEKAGAVRQDIADKRYAEQQKYIPRRTKQLEAARKQLAEAKTEQQKQSAKRAVERAEQTLADLKVRPDPASIDDSNVAQYAYQGASCKIGGYIKAEEKKDCLVSTSRMSGVSDPEAFCACSANKVAESWLRSDKGYGSSLAVQMTTQARSSCRS